VRLLPPDCRRGALPERPLDWRGSARHDSIRDGVECLIDGNPAMLVDLSAIGAQVISQVVLRPNQRVRMTMADEGGVVRFNAAVAWASFEIPTGTPQYRAGIEFTDADAKTLNTFASSCKTQGLGSRVHQRSISFRTIVSARSDPWR
jgi:hypothetical protein